MMSTPHHRVRSFWPFTAVMLLALAFLPAAAFATGQPNAANCIIHLEPSHNGQASATTDGPCFETLAEAVAAATGNRVQLPKTASPADIDQALHADEVRTSGDMGTAASYVLSIEYQHINFEGDRFIFYGPTTCASASYFKNLDSVSNDRISSSHGYSYCNRVRHFRHIDRGGIYIDCTPSCEAMGEMNDRTSSIVWRYN